MKDAFCKRNLKPFFALLIVLVIATIAWAVLAPKKKSGRAGQLASGSASARLNAGQLASGSASARLNAGQLASGSAGARPGAGREGDVRPGAGAASPNRTGEWNPGAGNPMNGAKSTVDAVSLATPNGGINLIAQPGNRSPSVGSGAPGGPARMRLIGAGLRSAPRGRHAFNTVSSLILPSVVGIHAAPRYARLPLDGPGHPLNPEGVRGRPDANWNSRAYQSVGSGFIVDSRGYALTNYHVIAQATDILVSVFGRTRNDFHATVIAVDPVADLALIRISGAGACPEARLGDSHSLQAGDWVLAFGSPFGLEQTVTQGIISSKRKSLVVGGVSYGDMLQTDAPTNLGSSGGPLVNLRAEVIGINTAIYGPSGVFSGTGFAIPVDRAKAFLARCSHVFNR